MGQPIINGKRFSWASAETKIDGNKHTGYTAINWKQGLKPGRVQGAGVYPLGDTVGEYTASADIEMLIQDMAQLRKDLAAKHENGSYALVNFDIVVHLDNGKDPIHEIKLVGCRIDEEDNSLEQSADPTKEKVALYVRWIEKDGLRMLGKEDAGV